MTLTLTRRTPWHPVLLILTLALWLATAGNLPLWRVIWQLPETQGWHAVLTVSTLVLAVMAFTVAVLCLLVWPRWLKPVALVLLALAASSSYFMQSYGVVIDASMIANVVNTNTSEALDLLSWSMLWTLCLGLVLPGLWLWRQPVRPVGSRRLLGQQLGTMVLALVLAVVLLWLSFQDVASLMRNHKSLRYMINPFNTVYALVRHGVGQAERSQQVLQALGEDAHVVLPVGKPGAAPLIVLVVGETARADNFGLGSYARDTTPELRQLQGEGDLVYYSQVSSCGTNTETSVPCMFSHLVRKNYVGNGARYENLLDILQHAGLAVLWLDNQSGCKGVCDRVPHADTHEQQGGALCDGDECLDEALLRLLPAQLAQLDPAKRARGTVVVLHQMGSHGPAYFKRSTPALKAFLPECNSNALQDCPTQQLVNAYDNSLRYTDHFLAQTIHWLQTQAPDQPTALMYVSDHGESLGEKGLYLHGMPYALAPQEQTHVPMLMWFSKALQQERGLQMACAQAQASKPWSHDNLFHTVLDLSGVQTRVAQAKLDMLSACEHKLL
ncbi:phosphoethanolamine transferase [Rhodoferax sp. BLA1]|uniref:phosphoethanolamine transferase n=1 Tax=Rhodoferax sp. BLA1 TaxID=2576062 RepID=UPI00210779A9|nr:phosphoethanolamine--lipid A transferase [Rhodoferax sp. BLA1]